jgi:WD40 repeat protein
MESSNEKQIIVGHNGPVTSVAVHGKEEVLIASGSADGTVRAWQK